MSGVFVTAIGTDCGKTHVAAAILRELTARGRPVLALKPVMSGFSPDELEASDAGRLLRAMGQSVSAEAIAGICLKSFVEPLAPNVAARRAGVAMDYADLLGFVRGRMASQDGLVLVEGAGGVMSPLTDTHTNVDLAGDLGLPVLLLASSYLGAVSHTLTALDVLLRRGCAPNAIVVTQPAAKAGEPVPFIEELARWTDIPLVAAPFARDGDGTLGADLVTRLFA
jgi:dethiobiotin synthetase